MYKILCCALESLPYLLLTYTFVKSPSILSVQPQIHKVLHISYTSTPTATMPALQKGDKFPDGVQFESVNADFPILSPVCVVVVIVLLES